MWFDKLIFSKFNLFKSLFTVMTFIAMRTLPTSHFIIDKCDKLAKYYGVTIDSLVHQDNKVDDIKIAPAPIGKHLWGTVTIGSKGQIVIPKAARETFELNEGDRLVVLGDDAEGIALVKADVFEQRVQEALKLSRQMTNE